MKCVHLESGNQAHFNTIDTETFNKFMSGTDDSCDMTYANQRMDDEETKDGDGDDAHSDVLLSLTGTITQNIVLTYFY